MEMSSIKLHIVCTVIQINSTEKCNSHIYPETIQAKRLNRY